MSSDENTLIRDLPESTLIAFRDELVNVSKDNIFTPYMLAKAMELERSHECFPFKFPEDMTNETKSAVAEVITNFFNNDVKNAESVPELPIGLAVWVSTLPKEHAQHVFIVAVHTVRERFPNWIPMIMNSESDEGSSK